jgi:hypothetical protein
MTVMELAFVQLWKTREKPSSLGRWLQVWVKRAYHFVPLIRPLLKPRLARLRGAAIGRIVILGRSNIQGKCAICLLATKLPRGGAISHYMTGLPLAAASSSMTVFYCSLLLIRPPTRVEE